MKNSTAGSLASSLRHWAVAASLGWSRLADSTKKQSAEADAIWPTGSKAAPNKDAFGHRVAVGLGYKKNDPTLEIDLLKLVESETGGDPEGHRQYVRCSLRSLSERLGRGSANTIAKLLKPLGFSLKTNIKRLIGKPHPQRDQQYRFIQRCKALFIRHGQPVISVDAKKSELIGAFKNSGARYCRTADEVNTYDFPSDAAAKAIPYGIYDAQHNKATVVVGTSAGTPQFAVHAIRHWWEATARLDYPEANHLMIEADSGGCNGHRPRMWKAELQRFCNDTGVAVTVCHYPPGASKWNPIEHRLFSQISRNWAGHPLRTLDVMLSLIRGTTTGRGLEVQAVLDGSEYEKGLTISASELKDLNLTRRQLCPNLNYTIGSQNISGRKFPFVLPNIMKTLEMKLTFSI